MLRSHWMAGWACGLLVLCGCGGGETAPQATKPAGSESKLKFTDDTPDGAVAVFLEAVKTGDDGVAAEMLTKLARQKTEEMELVVAPPGGDDMSYEVGEVESLSDDIAHVACMWSDGKEEHDVVWALRREDRGWRIAGMATQYEGVPLLLNFEDPEDMFRQQEAADEEIARREEASAEREAATAEGHAARRAVHEADVANEDSEVESPQPRRTSTKRPARSPSQNR